VSVDVHSATPERWDDIVALFTRPGPRGGTPITSGCWCRFWLTRGKENRTGWGAGHRAAFEEEVRSGSIPGLLAYEAGEPVGWCRVGPRETFARLEASRTLVRVDDEPAWSVVCFYVQPSAKRQGVASALLEAAVTLAAERGTSTLEGYAARVGDVNIDAFTGYLPMFLAAGFEPVADGGRRTIVRRHLP
jgi:GNAT superfamily N-acetyltransferase